MFYSINEKRTPPNTLSLNKQKDTSNINKEIQHIQGDLNNDLYAVPMKNNAHECTTNDLPAGWEKHEGRNNYLYLNSNVNQNSFSILKCFLTLISWNKYIFYTYITCFYHEPPLSDYKKYVKNLKHLSYYLF